MVLWWVLRVSFIGCWDGVLTWDYNGCPEGKLSLHDTVLKISTYL